MMNTILGIEKEKAVAITNGLNVLLSNLQVHYQNLRGLHWNIKGKEFFELHVKYEEYYTDIQDKIDEVAERILTLEGEPLHTFEDYVANSAIPVGKGISNGEEGVRLLVHSLETLIEYERNLLALTDEADDEGTNALISEFLGQQEKELWMLKAWLA